MKKGYIFLSAVAALGLSGQSLADGISYSYVEADYLNSKLKGFGDSISGDGFRFGGSVALGTNWIGFLDIGRTKYSEAGSTFKFTPTQIGVGYHMALGDSVDVVGKLSYARVKVGFSGIGSASESGYGLSAGLRGMAGEKVEWSTTVQYRDVGDLESILGFSVGGRYYVTPAFAVGLDLSSDKFDEDTFDVKEQILAVTFRYNFGA